MECHPFLQFGQLHSVPCLSQLNAALYGTENIIFGKLICVLRIASDRPSLQKKTVCYCNCNKMVNSQIILDQPLLTTQRERVTNTC